jgi:hypothetical protein
MNTIGKERRNGESKKKEGNNGWITRTTMEDKNFECWCDEEEEIASLVL